MADRSNEIRKGWNVGSECLIYSKSRNEWSQGKIVKIYNENEEEWLSIEYKNRIKDVKRYDTQVIAPLEIHLSSLHNNLNRNIHVKQELTNDRTSSSQSNNNNVKKEITNDTTIIQNIDHYPGPVECIVYWDYFNNPIPSTHNFQTIIPILKQNICNKIGYKPIQFRVYSVSNNLGEHVQDTFDTNGIEQINVKHHTSITNRLTIDITLKLLELEKNKTSNCIGVISKDISHLLSRIHNEQTISNLFIISLQSNTIYPSPNNVDFVLTIPINTQNNNKKDRVHNNVEKEGKLKLNFDELNVELNCSIKTLKRAIKVNKLQNYPGYGLSIQFNGRILKTQCTIGECGIHNGDTIHWMLIANTFKNGNKKRNINKTYIDLVKSVQTLGQQPKCKKRKLNSYNNKAVEIILENVNTKQRRNYNMNENDKIHLLRVKMAETI
eukprot:99330_1